MLDRELTLTLTRQLLREIGESPLASFEDADYFRKWCAHQKKQTPTPSPKASSFTPALPPVVVPSPLPLPKPAPVIVKEPTPPSLAPPPKPASPNSLFSLLAKIAPEFPILREIPNDEQAQKIANRWKTKNQSAPISILSCGEPAEHKLLLEQITQALDVYFGPARLILAEPIEKEKQWEAFLSVADLKLILCCDYTLWQMRNLMKEFKEVPNAATRHLGKVPLFLLPDLSLYLKDPLLKRSLWKALCQTISSL